MTEKRLTTETIFYVLLALGAPLGYGIMQQVNELTAGRVALGAGTLYGALTNLTEKGWDQAAAGGAADERKKEYVITDAGREKASPGSSSASRSCCATGAG